MWEGDNLILHTSNQMLNQGRDAVARTLQIPVEKVRLISPYHRRRVWLQALGQCRRHFGGDRCAPAQPAGEDGADASANIPCHDAPFGHHSTHPPGRRTETGRILAIGHDVFSGNLWSEQTYEGAALQTRTLYAGDNRLTRHRLAPLDIPVASSMRAPGEAVGLLALECAMDELAERLDLDPIELRMRNEPTEDPEKHIPYSSRHLIPCLQEGARRFGWDRRNPKPGQSRDGRWLVGMGVAAATRGNTLQLSKANVRLGPDGFGHCSHGDDRYRHGDLHHSDPDRG